MAAPSTSPVRPAHRRLALVAAAAVAAPVLAVVGAAAPAEAAWLTGTNAHGGKAQVCKVPVRGQRPFIRVRLDNRGSGHAHRVVLSRTSRSGSATVAVQAPARRVSATKQLRWRAGDLFEIGISEVNGPGQGGGLETGRLPVC